MSTLLNWELLRSFMAVMESKSLLGASKALQTTQPTVGRHIDTLEAELNTRLFTRSNLGLIPTDKAYEILPHVKSMHSSVSTIQRVVSGQQDELSGVIRISCSEVVGIEILPQIVLKIRNKYPKLNLELVLSNSSNNLLTREADIAVRMYRPTQGQLLAKKLGETPLGLFAHKKYLKKFGTPKSLEDLKEHVTIAHDANTFALQALKQANIHLTRDTINFRTDSEPAQHALIRAAAGIGAMQIQLAKKDKNLEQVLSKRFHLPMEMWLVMHEDLRGDKAIKSTFDLLAQELLQYVDLPDKLSLR